MIASVAQLPELSTAERPALAAAAVPCAERIEVVECSAERLVIRIPATAKGHFVSGMVTLLLGCGLLILSLLVAIPPLRGLLLPLPPGAMLFVALEMGVLWLGEAGAVLIWLKHRFTRLLISVERNQFAVQESHFNFSHVRTIRLMGRSRASLLNSSPRAGRKYALRIHGATGALQFGDTLASDEKRFLVCLINGFLYAGKPWMPDPFGRVEESSGEIDPACVDVESHVVIEEVAKKRLRLRTRVLGHETARFLAGLIAFFISVTLFVVVWLGLNAAENFLWPNGGTPAWVTWTFEGLKFLPPLVGQAVGLWLLIGRTSFELTPEQLTFRWHWGRFGFTRTVPTESVSGVTVVWHFDASVGGHTSILRSVLHARTQSPLADCMIQTANKPIRLSLFDSLEGARTAAGVIRWQLSQWGLLASANSAGDAQGLAQPRSVRPLQELDFMRSG